MITRFTELEKTFNAAVDTAALGVDLRKVAYPVAAFTNSFIITDGQCEQCFQFTDTQVFPE